MTRLKAWIPLFIFLIVSFMARGQGYDNYQGGLKIKFPNDSLKFVRFITWHQMYIRAVQNNPGTAINGQREDISYDIGMRRSRILIHTSIHPRLNFVAHFGINNQTFTNGGAPGQGALSASKKPQLFMHDMWTEYTPIKYSEESPYEVRVGAGLLYWTGLSRLTNSSTLNFMLADAPIFNYPTIERKDQFARQYGIYSTGHINKLHYRVSLLKPFNYFLPARENEAIDAPTSNWATSGYFEYQLWEKEMHVLPYTVGTYVGSKKVFNIGAGWYHHPRSTHSINTEAIAEEVHDMTFLSGDVFFDLPIANGKHAITLYGVYYNYNFGPNYLRSVGIMNIADKNPYSGFTGQVADQGFGNAEQLIGSGHIYHIQGGFLLPEMATVGRLQPVVGFTYSDFEALDAGTTKYAMGLNWFIRGHHARIRGQYQLRQMVFDGQPDGHRGEFIMETQLYF